MQEIQFGMLQTAKAREIKATQAGVAGAQLGKAEDIFSQYQDYKEQLQESEGASGLSKADKSFEISPQQLEAMLNDTVQEFNQYYALINETPDTSKNKNDGEKSEDEKNKIPPKEFGGLMA